MGVPEGTPTALALADELRQIASGLGAEVACIDHTPWASAKGLEHMRAYLRRLDTAAERLVTLHGEHTDEVVKARYAYLKRGLDDLGRRLRQ